MADKTTDNPTAEELRITCYAVVALNAAPSSKTDTGQIGDIRFTADYIYLCVATNSWKRAALSAWLA